MNNALKGRPRDNADDYDMYQMVEKITDMLFMFELSTCINR